MGKCENTDNQCVCGRNEGSGNPCYFRARGKKMAVEIEAWNKLVDEKLDLERRVESHIKGEGCKHFCPDCDEPSWFVDDEDMTCLFCGHKGFPIPDIDAEQIA